MAAIAKPLAALGIIAVWLTACAAHVDGLKVDEQFNYSAVRAGGMAVIGVVSVDGPLSAPLRNRYAGMFLREIRKERPRYPLLSAGEVNVRVGPEYDVALDDYRYVNALSADNIRLFRSADLGARYLAFARIEGTSTERSRTDEEILRQDDQGNIVENYVEVTLSHERQVIAIVNIFDLNTGASVWSGEVSQTRSNENTYQIDKDERFEGALLSAVVNTLLFGDTGREYPEPPEFDRVLKAVFNGFAENFPESE